MKSYSSREVLKKLYDDGWYKVGKDDIYERYICLPRNHVLCR